MIQKQNCEEKFEEVATSSRFNFIGNIDLGNDLPLSALKPHYDAILLAYGASKDKELGIPGEKALRSVYSARAFVGWYNGLPEHRDLDPDLSSGEDAVIVGQGNVALDVARILLSDVDTLRKTDIASHAVEALSKSKIKRVRVVGRRGPMQVSQFALESIRITLTSFFFFRLLLLSKKFANCFSYRLSHLSQFAKTSFLRSRSLMDYREPRRD